VGEVRLAQAGQLIKDWRRKQPVMARGLAAGRNNQNRIQAGKVAVIDSVRFRGKRRDSHLLIVWQWIGASGMVGCRSDNGFTWKRRHALHCGITVRTPRSASEEHSLWQETSAPSLPV